MMRYTFDDNPDSCGMPPYIYGGTTIDWYFIVRQDKFTESQSGDVFIRALGLVDLPFSLVADTVLLPVSIPMQVSKNERTMCE